MHSFRQQRLQMTSCPGHARVRGNERADRLPSRKGTTGLMLGKAGVLRGLSNFLRMDMASDLPPSKV